MTQQSIESLYEQALNRKSKPEESSYTNYLYNKGLDKILKKIGEESTEVILGAKNTNDELIYETADLLFHLMVLLVEKDVSLDDIKDELGSREGQESRLHERKDWRV
ncbi:phosphoribosyl-ATP diphosphatase [Leuconostoc gelidum subsp. aenigmaticum]|mgnify:FL=1|jgi:phosphoribosyl-ATP pyrophosphohydrolase|uniref:Phosphoribosyl-ATP pyrophosphatase n=1 Tax=Leuconostoc gelidum subsp. gelidum TaxID=1607839 RepID=A0AB35FY87_LEUGE|nr:MULTISPECIES: phosphoribosyl-ATP diphosphatase [Leuconostoc]MBR2276810.1 phosphoribosyl-ATP diphosphatase [Leuconostoc sp.]AFS40047.1 phosphoribosyl-ATP pyrophosphohydrolase [Leuconostoc gelidum JB7]MBZ5964443.1 phosphoribosyl-ATP diphosphatase [Leuconostoc gelidum subsp. gelidum]MBZ5969559.1 phosphoribosyl-ATP diphosphatase [Leuconostoc gasicomitatum]MBZ5974958.1 phosphoribosyl-ATP diphosphatase [Leuconostoc gelidum subsp. gelidum]